MKLEHLFLGVCFLLLAATGLLAVHYRTELLLERERARTAAQPGAIPNVPAVTPPSAMTLTQSAIDDASARADMNKSQLIEQLRVAENGQRPAIAKPRKAEPAAAEVLPPDAGALTTQQIRIKEAPAIATIKDYKSDHGIAVLDHGSDRGLKTDQQYAVRRGHYVVARKLVIGETVEANECAAIVDVASLQPGEVLRAGDEVIKWEP